MQTTLVPSIIQVEIGKDDYLPLILKFDKTEFVLYRLSIYVTDSDHANKTSWKVYLRYSELDKFHRKLESKLNSHCLSLPKLPSKQQWRPTKLDNTFIAQRIQALNIYFNELSKYVTKSSKNIQDLFSEFFEIDDVYKYIVDDNVEILSQLIKCNNNVITQTDSNNSNILHFAVAFEAINIIKWMIQNVENKETIMKMLNTRDHYQLTPLVLLKHIQNKEMQSILLQYIENDDEEEKSNENMVLLPYQYKHNAYDHKRNLWIIINPISGKSQTLKVWQQIVQPFLEFNSDKINYETLITQYQLHAQKECQTLESHHTYDGIVCVGGDGTIAEVVNGLYRNNNLSEHVHGKKICITPIPTGTGNALATEMGIKDVLNALKRLLYGFETCIDGYLASQVAERDVYGFIGVHWGTIAAIDFESESYRWMGSFRFTVAGALEVALNSHYKARIYFKPMHEDILQQFDANDVDRTSNDDDNWWHKLRNIDADESEMEPEYPADWVCVEGDFLLITVTNMRWISSDNCMGGDDFNVKTNTLRVIWNKKKGRRECLSVLSGFESGKHLDLDSVKYFDVEEVVIEPLGKGPPMNVDGERKPLKPVYVKILPSDLIVTF